MVENSDKLAASENSGDISRAIEALSEGFALFDADEQLVLVNSRFTESHPGLKGILAKGLSWSIFMTEVSRRNGSRGLDQVDIHIANGMESPLTLQVARPGDRWVRIGLYPIKDGGFVLTETDVTDVHAAEEMRAEADGLLREILDACASRIALSRIDDGEIIYQTPAWQQLYGAQNKTNALYADAASYSDLLAEVLPTGSVDDFETTMLRKDGTSFPARISGRLVDFGGDQAIVTSSEDMTHVFAQRDEIVRVNQRLLDAIEAMDQGFVLFGADGRLLMANETYLRVNACIAEQLKAGTHNDDIVDAAVACGHEALAAAWPQHRDDQDDSWYEFELADGRMFSASRRSTSDGGYVITWRDITRQKTTERELVRRREAALQDEKLNALGQLLAGVAHELNNPLSVVVGYAMMLKDEVEDPEALQGIEKISTSAERCAKIVKTFLAMARQKPVTLESVGMNEIIVTALDVASFGIRKNGAQIDVELSDAVPDVLADEDQITQVLINLLVNAEHALASLGSDAKLFLTTHYDQVSEQVVTTVQDNGPGVPQDIRARIFEPFFTTKAIGEGTGVGLAISHRIVSSHGGSLTLTDAAAGGACFTMTLPRAQSVRGGEQRAALPGEAEAQTALVVEDEVEVAQMIAKMLGTFGVTATLANSAEQAIEIIQSDDQFDFVLCDLQMPGMGGRALLSELERRWPRLAQRLAFVSGDAISEDADIVRRQSTRPLLEKPVSPPELQRLVRQLVKESEISK